MKPNSINPLMVCLLVVSIAACDNSKPQAAPAASVPEVKVVKAVDKPMPLTHDLVGRLAATRIAEVRARVAGIITERSYNVV